MYRKYETSIVQNTNESAGKLHIKCPDSEDEHPHCQHGPTLLFYHGAAEELGYYGCAAYRDKGSCSFHVAHSLLTAQILARRYETDQDQADYQRQRALLLTCNGDQLHYCLTCCALLNHAELPMHESHIVQLNLSVAAKQDPTKFLPPLDNDKAQAQYFFDAQALQLFTKCFADLNISNVVCLGAPRLHAHLSRRGLVKSYLLDFDKRFHSFYDDEEFAWHNMCNNHFFVEKQRIAFERFLTNAPKGLLLFTDPPFGCRTETIAHTLHQLTRLYNRLQNQPHVPLPIFWVFPYFAAHYIEQVMPELAMCHYKVNYTNHAAYTNVGDKSRKLGSPVRVFTNVPLDRLHLPDKEYHHCAKCAMYTGHESVHCDKCGCCPSRNGATYRHCAQCGVCVKPNYEHCKFCRRCTQVQGHNCAEYQAEQRCWICLQRGHVEWHCKLGGCQQMARRMAAGIQVRPEIICLLCGKNGHNERNCQHRSKFVEERTFMGETEVLRFLTESS